MKKYSKFLRISKYFATLMVFVFGFFLTVFSTQAETEHPPRVVDDAGLLSQEEDSSLTEKLNEISETYGIDVCVVTVDSFEEASVQAAADDYYDYNGYGMDEEYSGVMLYISMEYRDWYITTTGKGIEIFSDSDIADMGGSMRPHLSTGNYCDAFMEYAHQCEVQIKEATTYHWGRYLGVSLFLGVVVSFVYILILKSKLKSVAPVDTAAGYVVPGSMAVTGSQDMFLYKKLDVTKRESSSSQSGSSTHRSSSGRRHGGGGGKF